MHHILYKNIKKQEHKINKFTFEFIHSVSSPKSLFGSHVTHEVLNEARMRGSLFIRKCENNSFIHMFAKQLYKKNSKYIYD